MYVLNAVAPVFAIIALGAALRKFNFMSEAQFSGLNRLTYWVGLPCLLFNKIASTSQSGGAAIQVFSVILSAVFASILISLVLIWLMKIPAHSAGAFVQASFRGNLAFVGLPVIIYAASGLQGVGETQIVTLAVLTLALMVPLYNILSVLVMLVGRQRLGLEAFKRMARELISNPLLLASVGGLVVSFLGLRMYPSLQRTTAAIGQMSLPLALVGIGASLIAVKVRGSLVRASSAALIKVAVMPMLGYAILKGLNLGAAEAKVACIYLACPTAASSYILVEQLDGDVATAAGAIVISTLLAMVSLSLAVAFG